MSTYSHQYYLKHRNNYAKASRKYYQHRGWKKNHEYYMKHRQHLLAYQYNYRHKNHAKQLAYDRRYRKEHRAEINARDRRWRRQKMANDLEFYNRQKANARQDSHRYYVRHRAQRLAYFRARNQSR